MSDVLITKAPKGWIDLIQTLCIWVIVAGLVIFMLPVIAMAALTRLVGSGPDAYRFGAQSWRHLPVGQLN